MSNDTVWVMSASLPSVYTTGPLDTSGNTSLPPTLPGKGLTFADPAFGATILQVTDATDGGTSNSHAYAAWPAMSRDNAYFIVIVNGTWKLYSFGGGPPMSSTFVRTFANQNYNWERAQWDLGGSNNTVCSILITDVTEANRLFQQYNAATDTVSTVKDYASVLRTSGTITSASSSSSFASTNIVEPVTDYTPEYFVNMKLMVTNGTLSGQERVITAFTQATGAFTTTAFTGTPGIGDAFYVRPAGYQGALDMSESGRYLIGMVAKDNGVGTQDSPGCVVAYDKTLDTLTVHHCSSAEIGSGIHQIYISKDQSYAFIWGVPGNTFNIWNFSTNTMATKQTDGSHADGGSVSWAQVGPASNVLTTRPFASPTNSPTTIATLNTKQTKSRYAIDSHISWCSADQNSLFFSSYYALQTIGMTKYSGTNDMDAIYKRANWLGFAGTQALPLTAANQGFVWDTGVDLTNKGAAAGNVATAALITGAGQWAYDTTNNDLFVRGSTSQDLSNETTYQVIAADARSQHDELVRFDFAAVGVTRYQRICRFYAYLRTVAQSYDDSPRASASYDSKYVTFTSTWGGRNRRDVFVVQVP